MKFYQKRKIFNIFCKITWDFIQQLEKFALQLSYFQDIDESNQNSPNI